jgi:hypothetical protein
VYIGNDLQVAFPSYRNIDNISGSFNGVTTSFALLINGSAPVPPPLSSNQCLISVNGVIQKPDDTGASGFRLSGGNIIFSSAPAGGATFFGVVLAGADYVNAGVNFPDGSLSAPSITFDQDNDTGYYRSASGAISFSSNGVASGTWNATGVTAPSFVPTGSTVASNGIYLPSANTVAISTNGSERLRIDASGTILAKGTERLAFNTYVSDANHAGYIGRDTSTGALLLEAQNAGGGYPMIFRTNSTERMRLTDAGLLGLGTSSPQQELHINDATGISRIRLTGGAAGADNFEIGQGIIGVTNAGFSIYDVDATATRLVVDSSGNVGIGTTSPSATLHVATVGNPEILIGGTATPILSFVGGAGSDPLIGYAVGALRFGTVSGAAGAGFTERMRIDTSGRVGIGTVSPSTLLDCQVDTNSKIKLTTSSSETPAIAFNSNGVADVARLIAAESGGGGVLIAQTKTTGGVITERARIDSSGRLLVGTSTARSNFYNSTLTTAFQVEGTTHNTSGISLVRNESGSASHLTLAATGGTTIGSTTIVSNGSSIGSIAFQGSDGTEFVPLADITAYVDGTPGANDMPGRIVLSTTADGASSTTERMRITNDGRVGIGTTGPASILHVTQPGDGNGITLSHSSRTGIWKIFHSGVNSENLAFVQNNGTSDAVSYLMGRDIHYWQIGNTERMRIDSSGRLLVGTSTARTDYFNNTLTAMLQVEGINSSGAVDRACVSIVNNNSLTVNESPVLVLGRSNGSTVNSKTVVINGTRCGYISFQGADGSDLVEAASIAGEVDGTPGANDMPGRLVFYTTADGASSTTERMRITNDGYLLVGATNGDPGGSNVNGFVVEGSNGSFQASRHGNKCADFNRGTDDGNIVVLRQDGVIEGTISVSGTTVSYNGAHLSRWSQLPGGAEREEILRGTVLSNIDEMCNWGEEDNEQLNRMKVSDVEGDVNVAGVFQAWDDDDDTYTDDFYCAMTGDFIIRIAEGTPVHRGQLLMSAGDGTAKPQGDGFVQDKTIAKVTSNHVTCTYDDGSYCVPCVLMAC